VAFTSAPVNNLMVDVVLLGGAVLPDVPSGHQAIAIARIRTRDPTDYVATIGTDGDFETVVSSAHRPQVLIRSKSRVSLLNFALVLLSMFFFYFARRTRTLVARSANAVLSSCPFYVSPTAHPSRICTTAIATQRNSHALGAIHPA
jgi:hypothetical protein